MTLTINTLQLPGVLEITPPRFGDDRGFFSETYNRDALRHAGIDADWVQDNHSLSEQQNVVRGLHYQLPPFAQAKLVRVLRGRILDVVVDIRKGSPTYGNWLSLEISREKWNQMFVPKGFAHGFRTLEPDTEVIYKVSDFYSAEHDRSIRYDDPQIGVDWELGDANPRLSDKDRAAPLLCDAENTFTLP